LSVEGTLNDEGILSGGVVSMITVSFLPVLHWLIKGHGITGNIMTLGRQTIGFDSHELLPYCETKAQEEQLRKIDGALHQETLFELFGFDAVHSLDVSDYEGCTHLYNLNDSSLPADLIEQYDLVVNGGTLEHVFDFSQGLLNTINMIKPGGYFLHAGPCNNWIDHGFYQFSPTLWFDFAQANEFDILVSASFEFDRPEGLPESVTIRPLKPREGKMLHRHHDRLTHLVLAKRRKPAGDQWNIPKQDMYLSKHGDDTSGFEIGTFYPFSVRNGVRKNLSLKHIPVDKSEVKRVKGTERTFFIRKKDIEVKGSTAGRPFRSPVVILENSIPLPFQASSADDGFDTRPGRFFHRGARIYFSASDGSDVLGNTHSYEILITH
jgi:hypothetical protein